MAEFEAWERIEALIEELPEGDLAYITIQDRTYSDDGTGQVGRVDLEGDYELQRLMPTETENEWGATKKALLTWIKKTAEDNAYGMERTVFKVTGYRHKGLFIRSAQFTVKHSDVRSPLVAWQAPPDVHGYEDANLGQAVDNYGKINAIRHYDSVMAAMLHGNNAMMGQMMRLSRQQEQRSTIVIDRIAAHSERLAQANQSLSESLIAGKLSKLDAELTALEAERAATREERENLERQKMATTAGKMIQETVETIMVGKAISPEVKTLLSSLQGTEMEMLMKDPRFQAIVKDPNNRAFMVEAISHLLNGLPGNEQGPSPEQNPEQSQAPEEPEQPGQ